jgi:hypothetical protein
VVLRQAELLLVGYFKKNLENYAGQSKVDATPFNLHTPVGGALWNEALAKRLHQRRHHLHPQLHLPQPSRPRPASRAARTMPRATPPATIVGQPGDPVANFRSPPSRTRRRPT